MSVRNVTNYAVSVFSRLKNLSRVKGLPFQRLLMRYAIERFLYRLGCSPVTGNFVLKGGNLFIVWQQGDTARTTMDSDFLFFGDASEEHLKTIFAEIALSRLCPEDGMRYVAESIEAFPIRQDTEYGGTRITMDAFLGTARIPMLFDIGVGDAITPAPVEIDFPVLLPLPVPRLRTYPAVTSIAEKVENMLISEMDNSRMKDFYDVWLLSVLFSYDFFELQKAIQNTLRRRGTVIPVKIPVTFTDTFGNNTIKQIQWKAFLRKSNLGDAPKDLQVVIDRLASFILPVFQQDMRKTIWNPLLGCWEEKHD